MSIWTIAWLAWLGLFGIIESAALFNSKSGDTLSEHVWAWFGVRTSATSDKTVTWWTRTRRVVLLGFLAWLSVHFLGGGRFV